MQRKITGFHQDEEATWVAELDCGHCQHVRHAPPWQLRPWVTSEEGRRTKLGADLDCLYCNMAALPAGLTAYKQTATFCEADIPGALLRDHRTKPGVWAEIVVEEGKLEYASARGTFVLRPTVVGIVEPEQTHRVRALGPVRFHVRFSRA